jgi:carboxymethylenebutenolidase
MSDKMDQKIIDLYDEYTHKPLSRAAFLQRLIQLVGSASAAASLLPLLESRYNNTNAANTNTDDLWTETIAYEGINGQMAAFVARPVKLQKYPAVIVLHENRGLTPHIIDVTLRTARAGFLAIAPNALAVLGGTPENEDDARQLFQTIDQEAHQENMMRVFKEIYLRNDYSGKVGCVGFCWGGAMAGTLATLEPKLRAAVVFYGKQPPSDQVSTINAALQLHYASLDERVNAGIADFINALETYNIRYEMYMYEGVNHAFHNDTSTSRYDESAATLAWNRSIDFLHNHLGE